MKRWIYKWLPIIFGCHCRGDRSFYWKNQQFPICARCTGELIGMLFFMGTAYWVRPGILLSFIFCIPMILDGFLQLLTKYESKNWKRFVTGFFFGYGFISIILEINTYSFLYGKSIGIKLKTKGI